MLNDRSDQLKKRFGVVEMPAGVPRDHARLLWNRFEVVGLS